MLLTGDAEAEAVPIDPGPVDVLKVAHHGSEDAGLAALLVADLTGAGGDLGRRGEPVRAPGAGDVASARAEGVRVLRTDRDGTITLRVARSASRVE